METKRLELSVDAVPASVRCVRRRVGDAAADAGIPGDVVQDVRLCVTEAVANAVVHAYGPEGGVVDVELAVDAERLTVVVRDTGGGIGRRSSRDAGYGLRLIRELSPRCSILSTPALGTEVRMPFPRATTARSPAHGR